jgi:rhodanese-related sulfurtransferase
MIAPLRKLSWKVIKTWIRKKFPQVQPLSVPALATWLNQATDPPLLLDARTTDEYEVSHLLNAHRVSADLPALLDQLHATPDTPMVVYCSVGYRSARLAERLQQMGYQQVFNLEGSLFEWVNSGYPVYQGQQAVRKVHPYNAQWGKLLRPEWRD